MNPVWAMLSATLGLNYYRHRKGKSTLCSGGRKILSPTEFIAGWAVLTGWLIPHFCQWRKKR